jgi:hypothetical protein
MKPSTNGVGGDQWQSPRSRLLARHNFRIARNPEQSGSPGSPFRYTDFLGTDPTLEVEWLQGCQQTIESRRIGVKAIGAPIPSVPFRASHLLR